MSKRFSSDRRLKNNSLFYNELSEMLQHDARALRDALTPVKRADGRYVTSEETLNRKIDPRIFLETQTKRFCRWLTTKPPLLRIFFNWLFVKKMKMKLAYFSKNEDKNPQTIYKTGNEHQIENQVTEHFKMQNLGHAMQLIQTEGLNILTDPVFGHLSKVLYPSKTKKFGMDVGANDLPRIDVILISHNHRDHVDSASLKAILKKNPNVKVFVPMGDRALFKKLGFKEVEEFGWHEEITLHSATNKKVTICGVPADHRSGRNGFDVHKCLVNGWVVSPEARSDILYFAGDTARLNDARMLSLALDIYALYQQKTLLSKDELPNVINMSPGGPNYTRRDMQPTHQSAVDSIASSFRLALKLEKVAKKDGKQIKASDWLLKTATIFMHHNKYELGPDRFNENIFIYERLLKYLAMDDVTLNEHLKKQQKKSAAVSLFHRRKDFIIHGANELKALARKIWPDLTADESKKELIHFIRERTSFPLINEKISPYPPLPPVSGEGALRQRMRV